jgi:predicted patatin/cPLA2 family phospholipase
MLRRVAAVSAVVAAVALAAVPGSSGCASSGDRHPPPAVTTAHKPAQIAPPIADSLAAALARSSGPVAPPKNALAISGGGQYAAYNAGMMVGWTAHGTRPAFDVVTGISSGAMVAAYAFLGDKYDPNLQRFFTTLSNRDLFAYRPITQFLQNGSLASPERLERLIADEVNECFMLDLQEAHRAGRRLYIGTMNVVTRRLTIWDLGAIACSGRPDAALLVRKVAQAAGSIPGLLPPVKFEVEIDGQKYVEEHVDGGAASQTFLRLPPGAERPADGVTGWLAGSNLYVLTAGKLYAPPLEGKIGFLKRVTSTISAALYALYRSELTNLYAFCGVSGMTFHTIAVPEDTEVPANSMTFEPEAMKRLFKLGYESAINGVNWRLTPPGTEPGEEETPRDATGVRVAPRR